MSPRRPRRSAPRHRDPAKTDPLSRGYLLETLIGGWRPLARLDIDGFALLRSRGITRRANSAVPIDPRAHTDALEDAVARLEGMWEAVQEPPTFRVFEGHEPTALDDLLVTRGYGTAGASHVLELALAPAPRAGAGQAPPHETVVGALDETWFDAAWQLAPRDGEHARSTLHDILAGTPAVQVMVPAPATAKEQEPIGVGRAALVEAGRERIAVLNMIAVHPEHRRQGIAKALSRTLLDRAAQQGATRALLEVEITNPAAHALYNGLGFQRITGYHYRVRAAPGEAT